MLTRSATISSNVSTTVTLLLAGPAVDTADASSLEMLHVDEDHVSAAVADLATAGRRSAHDGVATDSSPTVDTLSPRSELRNVYEDGEEPDKRVVARVLLGAARGSRAAAFAYDVLLEKSESPDDPRFGFKRLDLVSIAKLAKTCRTFRRIGTVTMKQMERVYNKPIERLSTCEKSKFGLPLRHKQLPNTVPLYSTFDANGVAVFAAPLPVFDPRTGTDGIREAVDECSIQGWAPIVKMQTTRQAKALLYHDGWPRVEAGELWTVDYIVGMGLPQFPYHTLARRRLQEHLQAMVVRKPPTVEGGGAGSLGQWRDVWTFLPADVRDLAKKLAAMPESEPSSQYYGVGWDRTHRKWRATAPRTVSSDGWQERVYFGSSETDAARAYDERARALGHPGPFNFDEPTAQELGADLVERFDEPVAQPLPEPPVADAEAATNSEAAAWRALATNSEAAAWRTLAVAADGVGGPAAAAFWAMAADPPGAREGRYWSAAEDRRFVWALDVFGCTPPIICFFVGSRSRVQVNGHAQKFVAKYVRTEVDADKAAAAAVTAIGHRATAASSAVQLKSILDEAIDVRRRNAGDAGAGRWAFDTGELAREAVAARDAAAAAEPVVAVTRRTRGAP